jgi:hypothetical protein
LDKHLSMFHALQDRFLAVMAQDPPVPTPAGELDQDWAREEVACALRLSHGHAANRRSRERSGVDHVPRDAVAGH